MMQTYEHYKDSGIDWIGQIPEHWECKRLGNWFEERRKKVSDKDFAPLSVTKNGIVPQLDSAAKSNDGDNRKLVMSGDFVINSRSDRKGSSGLSYLDGSVSLINIVMKPRGIYPKFSEFLLKSNGFIEEFYRNGHGIVADLWTTRYDEMKFIFLAIPPIQEQEAIANFLDEKTAKVDALVQTKEQQIEKLKELRQAKIHQAVTKGLDANVATKDLGVEWIGEIPAHWEVKLIKRITNFHNQGYYTTESYVEKGVKLMRITDFRLNGRFDLSDSPMVKDDNSLANYFLEKNDFVFARTGGAGNFAIIDEITDKAVFASYLIRFKFNNELKIYFLKYFFNSYCFKTGIDQEIHGGVNQNIHAENIKNQIIFIPPIQEQEQIVTYLDEVTGKIDQAIAQKQVQITKLKEYKQSLINDVVTGKVKVC